MSERNDHPRVSVVGATGLVGRELLSILGGHPLGQGEVRVLASTRSAGETVEFRGRPLTVEPLTPETLGDGDVVFLCASHDVSREYAPLAVGAGSTVIDNTSAFRMDPAVVLVIPEVNGHVLDDLAGPAIIANPNCSTIIALMAVTPLHRAVGVERMVVSTYQAASGAGRAFLDELEQQARDHVAGQTPTQAVIGRQYIFNLFSHDSPIGPDGCNEEERKLVRETHKMWADDSVKISATCVRVPVLRAHSESINLTFREPLAEDDARRLIAEAAGVRVVDDRQANKFPEPVDASGIDEVLVGRIRSDPSQPAGKGLSLFVSGDQLRKGAALNAVQIAERAVAVRV